MNVKVSTKVYPLRLAAYMHNSVDVIFSVTNTSNEVAWVESDILLPESLSLSGNERITKGRIRMGIVSPKETIDKTIKIYSNLATYPDIYPVKSVLKTFNRFGETRGNAEHRFHIRCVKLSDMENENEQKIH